MKKTLLLSAFSFVALSQMVNAATIQVVNENEKVLTVMIKPEGGDKKSYIEHTIPADRTSEIKVPELDGKMYYSVEGSVNTFTPNSTCNHLHVAKKYQLTFQDDKVGTTCVASELGEDGKVVPEEKGTTEPTA